MRARRTTSRRMCLRALVVTLLGAFGWTPVLAQPAEGDVGSPRAVLDRYCVTCHNTRLEVGGLALDEVDPMQVGTPPALWEKVLRPLRTGLMPPELRPRPDAETYQALLTHFETALDAAAPDPGRPGPQRLNRTEYVLSLIHI